MVVLERTVRSALVMDVGEIRWFNWPKALASLPSLLLVHFVVLRAFVRSISQRKIVWRGITYEIQGPGEVKMLNYSPFRQATTEPDESVI